jgi:cytochrome P450
VCIGNTFALIEAVLVLATIAQRYRFTLVPGPQRDQGAGADRRPERPLEMVVHALP